MSIPPDDAVTIAPDIHQVVYENDQLRLVAIHVPPGGKAAMHRHPRNVTYVIAPGTLDFSDEKGTTTKKSFTPGEVVQMPESQHAVENTGTTEFRAVQIEFKT